MCVIIYIIIISLSHVYICQAESSYSDDLEIFCTFDESVCVVCAAISRLCSNLCPFYKEQKSV